MAVDAPGVGQALQAATGVPVGRGVVPVEILVGADVIRLFDAGDDAVPHGSIETTVVGVVRRTYETEDLIDPVLITVNRFPVSVWVKR